MRYSWKSFLIHKNVHIFASHITECVYIYVQEDTNVNLDLIIFKSYYLHNLSIPLSYLEYFVEFRLLIFVISICLTEALLQNDLQKSFVSLY